MADGVQGMNGNQFIEKCKQKRDAKKGYEIEQRMNTNGDEIGCHKPFTIQKNYKKYTVFEVKIMGERVGQ